MKAAGLTKRIGLVNPEKHESYVNLECLISISKSRESLIISTLFVDFAYLILYLCVVPRFGFVENIFYL
jgi:hypothetical protein